jgi:glycosyltransferase involved in cell wall biosynthesis
VEPEPGINVIGILSTATGLGAAGRSTLRVLEQRGIAHVAVDLGSGSLTSGEPMPASTPRTASLGSLPYSATVIQLNPDIYEDVILRWRRQLGYDMRPTVNAIVPFWELPVLPARWLPILRCVDVVLAPSQFVREAVERSISDRLRPMILDYPQVVHVPARVEKDRVRWLGDRSGKFTFLSSFDIRSDIERKNPWACVSAFQDAFAGRQDVTLVLKVNHAAAPTHSGSLAELERLAAEDDRVRLMTDALGRDDLWGLYASVDAYVSLHRAEGLGLGLMEAMAVGIPVVATGWSGNLDFMTSGNSVLVPYKLVAVTGVTHPNYRAEIGQQWAEPDTPSAAKTMRQLADSPQMCARLGAEAARSVHVRVEAQRRRGVLDELVEMAVRGGAASRDHTVRVRAAARHLLAQGVRPKRVWASSKRLGIRLLRRVSRS